MPLWSEDTLCMNSVLLNVKNMVCLDPGLMHTWKKMCKLGVMTAVQFKFFPSWDIDI